MKIRIRFGMADSRRRRRPMVATAKYVSDGPIGNIWVKRLRLFAIVTLILVGYTTAAPWNFVLAARVQPSARGELQPPTTAARFEATLRELRLGMEALSPTMGQHRAALALPLLQASLTELRDLKRQVLTEFDEVDRRIRAEQLPSEIQERHATTVSRFESDFLDLEQQLETLLELGRQDAPVSAKGSQTPEAQELAEALSRFRLRLDQFAPDASHTPIDPENLPHRTASFEERLPRLSVAEFIDPQDDASGEGAAAHAAGPPTPDDLAPNIDAPFTQEILELAASLGSDPLSIYEFVRNRVRFVPSFGSAQGGAACLSTLECNDVDTASLLVALLRAAGIPARYAIGTVEVPIDRVMNWLGGFTSPEAALSFIAGAGTPVVGLTSGGELVAARLEHVWVEAFVDFVPSRGAGDGGEGDTWVPLDPSFKQHSFTGGIDLKTNTTFDPEPLISDLIDSGSADPAGNSITALNRELIQNAVLGLETELSDFIAANLPAPNVGDLVNIAEIIPENLGVLPASLPYQTIVQANSVSTLPPSLRHSMTFEVTSSSLAFFPDLTFTATLPELAGKKLTLSYAPATAADEATLLSFLPEDSGDPIPQEDFPDSLPAYLVNVRPELRVDGAVVASGTAVTLGTSGRFRMIFNQPNAGANSVDNNITAGTYNAIVLNLGIVEDPANRLASAQEVLAKLQDGTAGALTKDDLIGELLYGAGLLFWSKLEFARRVGTHVNPIATARLPSEGIFTYDLKVSRLFGSPRTVESGALLTDVDTDVQAVIAKDGAADKAVDYFAANGIVASRAESAIWDELINDIPTGQGISAAAFIDHADQQGIPVFHINSDNVDSVVPGLMIPSAIKTDIRNAVNAGKIVTVPEREAIVDGFSGVGYIITDPDTGAGGYIISSGLAGGGFQLPERDPLLTYLLGILLVGIGIFASGGMAIAAVIAALALVAYDFISTLQSISRNNPNLTSDQLDLFTAALALFAIVGVVLTLIGIWAGTLLAFVAVAIVWIFYSIIASALIQIIAAIGNRMNQPFQAAIRELTRARDRWETAVARVADPPALAA